MCAGCPDFVEDCWTEGCYRPDGGPYSKSEKWFLGDWPKHPFCDHLFVKYGTRNSDLFAHLREFHELEAGWFSAVPCEKDYCYEVAELGPVCEVLNGTDK